MKTKCYGRTDRQTDGALQYLPYRAFDTAGDKKEDKVNNKLFGSGHLASGSGQKLSK